MTEVHFKIKKGKKTHKKDTKVTDANVWCTVSNSKLQNLTEMQSAQVNFWYLNYTTMMVIQQWKCEVRM